MVLQAKIIWALVATFAGTAAYQAYEHRQDLIDAAGSELPISVADSLNKLAPPDPKYASPDYKPEDTSGLAHRMGGLLDSARGAMANSNEKSCQGYCDFRRDKCVKVANGDRDLITICEDEVKVCYLGCKPPDKSLY
jgi:hypothetical protein